MQPGELTRLVLEALPANVAEYVLDTLPDALQLMQRHPDLTGDQVGALARMRMPADVAIARLLWMDEYGGIAPESL